jgi:hypothetical protein
VTPPSIKQHVGLGNLRRATLPEKGGSSRRSGALVQVARWNLSFRLMLLFQQRNRPDWQLLEKPLGVMPARPLYPDGLIAHSHFLGVTPKYLFGLAAN